ncbi:MAG: transglutaminase-like domain-containing protein [Candidatus Undinarchaeales archaeon]|nr:transglutaminase-like domain-containing protein [Candidatus Undinarchaeales archaeon]MDP7494371.1 transglutaminase-like domain-containing protein [Candidatus Undinarchaeales archaeon]
MSTRRAKHREICTGGYERELWLSFYATASRAKRTFSRAWCNSLVRFSLLTLLGALTGVAAHLTFALGGPVAYILENTWGVVPMTVGYLVSPFAGACVGAASALAAGIVAFGWFFAVPGIVPYILSVIAVPMATGALVGALPAMLAPRVESSRLLATLFVCTLSVQFAGVAPALVEIDLRSPDASGLASLPLIILFCFGAYTLVAAPILRLVVLGDGRAIGPAVAVFVVLLVVAGPRLERSVQSDPVDPRISHPRIMALADRLASSDLPDEDRISATLAYVRDDIGPYIRPPNKLVLHQQSALQTLERGRGDCVDKAVLLVTLLRHEGFVAELDEQPDHVRVMLFREDGDRILDPSHEELLWSDNDHLERPISTLLMRIIYGIDPRSVILSALALSQLIVLYVVWAYPAVARDLMMEASLPRYNVM